MKVSFKIDENDMLGKYHEDQSLVDSLKLFNKELGLDENDGVPPPKFILEDFENIKNKMMEQIALEVDRAIISELKELSKQTIQDLITSYVSKNYK